MSQVAVMTLLHCLLTAIETISLNCPDCVPSSIRRWRLPQVGMMKSLRTERLKGAPRRSESTPNLKPTEIPPTPLLLFAANAKSPTYPGVPPHTATNQQQVFC